MTAPEKRFRIQAMTRGSDGLVPRPREVPAALLAEEIPEKCVDEALELGLDRKCLVQGPKFCFEVRRIA